MERVRGRGPESRGARYQVGLNWMRDMVQNVGSGGREKEWTQQGLAGVLMRLLRDRWTVKTSVARKLQVIETISLGGKRQISLVRCGSEHFLAGGGFESVTAIVKLENMPEQGKPCG